MLLYRDTPGLPVLILNADLKDSKIGTLAAGHASRRKLRTLSLGT